MSRLATLKHLQDYIQHHDEGSHALKQSIWQLTKSRYNTRSVTLETRFDPDLVREELLANTRVAIFSSSHQDDYEPGALVSEHDSKEKKASSNKSSNAGPTFTLVDTVEAQAQDKENHPKKKETHGLRQRKNKKAEEEGWSMVEHEGVDNNLQQQQQLNHDPIELFGGGLTPRELKAAQDKAKQALQFYIAAANQAAAILSQLPNKNGDSHQ